MSVYVALLRGINVGGKHVLPMQQLRETLASLGCEAVRTYIQSGNAVFQYKADSKSLGAKIQSAIDKQFGFATRVHVLALDDFLSIQMRNPFPEAVDVPKSLHVAFLADIPQTSKLDELDALRAPDERFVLDANAFYLHAPDGIGNSKLAAKIEKCLGVPATSRNWRTVEKIAALAESIIR
jgi:uncharacterized protein (DUF1697 family)